MPTSRAGSRRSSGNRCSNVTGKGTREGAALRDSTGDSTSFWIATCARWVTRVGQSRRRWTAPRSSAVQAPLAQWHCQQVGRRHRVLDGQVDADAADRRHRMRGVANAQQSLPVPARHAVDLHLQQLDVIPARERIHRVGQELRQARHLAPEGGDALLAQLVLRSLRNDERALPVAVAVQGDQHRAGPDRAARARRVADRIARQPEPQHVDRRPEILGRQSRALAHRGVPAIRAHHQVGPDGERTLALLHPGADHAAGLLDQARDRRPHAQLERRQTAGLPGDEVQEIPLRNEHQELPRRGQVAEVGDGDLLAIHVADQLGDLLVRQLQECVQQAQVLQDRERGRMDGVAAEVAQEVLRASPAPEPRRRRARAGSPASCRPDRHRRCSIGS